MFLLHSDSDHDHTFESRRVVDQISFAKEKREGERRKKEREAFVYSILRHLSSIQSSRKLLEVSRRVPRVLAFASLSVLHVGDSPLTRDLFSRSRRKESELSGTFLFSMLSCPSIFTEENPYLCKYEGDAAGNLSSLKARKVTWFS